MMSASEDRDEAAVTNSQFLAELLRAAPKGTTVWVNAFIGNPNSNQASWAGKAYNPAFHGAEVDGWSRQNTYFSVGAVGYVDGQMHRRKDNFVRLLALVADDIEPEDLMGTPSWGLVTSPGKRQIGILLDTQDPDCANLALCSALVTSMADRGLIKADRSGNNPVRYVRLPVGQNQKPRDSGPFPHDLEYWNPAVRLTLEDAAAVFGVNLDELRQAAVRSSEVSEVSEVSVGGMQQDERLRALTASIIRGENLHDSINLVAASMVASGAKGGAIVNLLRGLMDASIAPRDDRWLARYNDIPRSVRTAEEKFRLPPPVAGTVDPQTGEIRSPQKPPLFTKVSDLLSDIKPVEWLIEGYLETDALTMIFGPSGGGKSFCVVDMACCIATGKAWHGHKTRQGAVFMIAGEGHNGLARRFSAWEKGNDTKLDASVPLFKSNRAVMMLDQMAAMEMAEEVERMVATTNFRPVLVQIDTLARNFGDGDENTQKDAGLFIEHVDHFIRRRWNCTVQIVHHTGHEMERARGSSAFKAAMDQELWVKNTGGLIELAVTKMKDAEIPPPKRFKIEQLDLVEAKDGKEVIRGAFIKLHGNLLDIPVCKNKKGEPILGRHIALAMHPRWPSSEAIQNQFGINEATVTAAMKRMAEAGLVEKVGSAKKSPWALTAQGLDLLTLTGLIAVKKGDDEEQQSSY